MDVHVDDLHQPIDEVLTQISRLTVDQTVTDDLKNCLTSLREMDIKRIVDGVAKCAYNASLGDIISMLIKFVNILDSINYGFPVLPGPLGPVFKVVGGVCDVVFKTDIALAIRQTFKELHEEYLMEKCKVSYMRINHCISYMKGLPDARTLSQEEKMMYLQLLAPDIDIFTGFDELTILGNSIKCLADQKSLDEFDKLMKKVELYCCLTTLRELFLQYRYGIQLAFNVGADSIRNVMTSQRQHDKDVLEFLWKPKFSNVHLIHNYNPKNWPITALFLEKRNLVENLSISLKGKSFHIESRKHRKLLTSSAHFFNSLLPDAVRCKRSPNGAFSVFTLHGGNHNTFSVYGHFYLPELVHFESTGGFFLTFTSNEETANGIWNVIKIEPDTPDGEPWYMFRLKANTKMCMYAGLGWFVYAKYVDYPNSACLWKLTQVKADKKGKDKEYETMV